MAEGRNAAGPIRAAGVHGFVHTCKSLGSSKLACMLALDAWGIQCALSSVGRLGRAASTLCPPYRRRMHRTANCHCKHLTAVQPRWDPVIQDLIYQATQRPFIRLQLPDKHEFDCEAGIKPASGTTTATTTPPETMKLQPSHFVFDHMYQQLKSWREEHISCHVPRYCFDAPKLGAWVRYLRKEHKEGRLEQWKVARY